jgi:MoaA/NifB/PqqE/SkfB family radical SAM enzyme
MNPSALSGGRIHFEITDRCNMACAHCMKRRESHDLDAALIARVLREASLLGARTVSFGGGEPTLHLEFRAILEGAILQGFAVTFVTNGQGFRRTWEWLREEPIGPAGVLAVSFSLDGADAETHDAVRAPGAYAGVLEGLDLCREAGIPTTTKTVVQRRNLGKLEGIVRLASEHGCAASEFAGMIPTRRGIEQDLQPSPAELAEARAELDRLAGLYRAEILRDVSLGHDVPLVCCDPYRCLSYSVDARGRLSLCCMLSALDDAADRDADIVADLASVSLLDAVPAFSQLAREQLLRRKALAARDAADDLEEYVCTSCAGALGKLDWLASYPASEWASSQGSGIGGETGGSPSS